jgi:hypothetical protein
MFFTLVYQMHINKDLQMIINDGMGNSHNGRQNGAASDIAGKF